MQELDERQNTYGYHACSLGCIEVTLRCYRKRRTDDTWRQSLWGSNDWQICLTLPPWSHTFGAKTVILRVAVFPGHGWMDADCAFSRLGLGGHLRMPFRCFRRASKGSPSTPSAPRQHQHLAQCLPLSLMRRSVAIVRLHERV